MTRHGCPPWRRAEVLARRHRLPAFPAPAARRPRPFRALAALCALGALLALPAGALAGTVVHEATDVPRRVPDTGTAGAMETSVLTVGEDDEICGAEGATVRDVDVRLDLLHDFNADLTVWLTSPDGTTLPLFGRIGGGSTGLSVLIDDEAVEEIAGAVTDFTARRPEGSLAGPGLCRFDGEKAVGDWKLDVHDWLGGGTGYLSSWALVLTCEKEGSAKPCTSAPPPGGERADDEAGEAADAPGNEDGAAGAADEGPDAGDAPAERPGDGAQEVRP